MTKKFIIFIFIVLLAGSAIFFWQKNQTPKELPDEIPTEEEPKVISMCFNYAQKTDRGFYDRSWVIFNIDGINVSGEFNNYPAEKDSKIGKFAGTVGPVDKVSMGRTANLWWDNLQEGIQSREELMIEFGDGSASAVFGEMMDRGDGVYIYADKTDLSFGPSMWQIDCDSIDEMILVEKYIRDNIKTIATDFPVLGGSWYVLSVYANYSLNEGEVLYEDGHIMSNAKFKYDFDANTKTTTIKSIELIK